MTDDDVRVDIARLAGQLDALARQLERIDTTCERRAASHVDRDLYASERSALREDITGLSERISHVDRDMNKQVTSLSAELKEARREDARTRRWLISTVVTLVIGLATVIVGVVA